MKKFSSTTFFNCSSKFHFKRHRCNLSTSQINLFLFFLLYNSHCKLFFILYSVWWLVAMLFSIILCVYSIRSMYVKYVENPVIFSFSHMPMSIGMVPFPALTVCTQTKFSSKNFNYTDVYRRMFKLDGKDTQNVTKDEYERLKEN